MFYNTAHSILINNSLWLNEVRFKKIKKPGPDGLHYHVFQEFYLGWLHMSISQAQTFGLLTETQSIRDPYDAVNSGQ